MIANMFTTAAVNLRPTSMVVGTLKAAHGPVMGQIISPSCTCI